MRLAVLCPLIFLALGVRAGLLAQEPAPQAGTARDVIIKADGAYNQKRYDEAVAGYRRFLEDFGRSNEAKELLPHVRYNLAAGLMQTQKFEAAAEAIGEALEMKEITGDRRENLMFWRGVALLQSGQADEARKALADFSTDFSRSNRRPDAALLWATALLADGKHDEAAKTFSAMRKEPGHPHRGRAAVLELHCLLETGRDKEALQLVAEEAPGQADGITQIATFQTLALGLGDKMLEDGRPREAIRALQAVWPRERLVAHQQAKLEAIRTALEAIERSPQPDIFQRAQLRQTQREVEKELASLEKIPSFDPSVRFRMARAFHEQDRFRECALLLDDMLRQMEPDNVVETASLSALQSWMAIERHDKAVEAAEVFEQSFPKSKSLPLVLYLRATALQQADRHDEAIAAFTDLEKRFPKSDQAPRSLFMRGFTQLVAERNEEAAATLEEFGKRHPDHEMAEAAAYWRGSALAFAGRHAEAREVLAAHSKNFPKGTLSAAAGFRHAYCAQAMKEYELASEELSAWLREHPEAEQSHEARILLGDALLAQGRSDEGKEAYASVPAGAGRQHEEAQFKLAKVLKLEEDHEGLRKLMGEYLAAYPNSPRAAEALFFIGQSWRSEDQPEKAIAEYWKAINEFGNNPEARSVEDLFLALGRHYKGESEKRDYLAELRQLREKATAEKQDVLAVRTTWALAQATRKTDPGLSVALLREASAMAKPEVTSPLILADCAQAQLATADAEPNDAATRRQRAAQLYRDLLKWHPRAVQKDQALGALARLALEDGDNKTAIDYYARLERDTPWSPLMGEAFMTRARLAEEAGKPDEAAEAYTKLLGVENVPGKMKAQALLALGELEMARNQPGRAVPYYQRIYILYGKWRDAVARAYLRSGEAFELLNDREAARKTYEELAKREDLAGLPETETAREKLEKMGPPAPASS
jgi:TolA-binding protein